MARRPLTRRQFIALIGAAAGATAVAVAVPWYLRQGGGGEDGPVAYYDEYPRRRIGRISELVPGEPVEFAYPHPDQPHVLIKLDTPAWGGVGPGADVVAFSLICPHMGCSMRGIYDHGQRCFGPCSHFTFFDLTKGGVVTMGQSTENVPQVVLEAEGDDLYATGIVGLLYGFANNLQEVIL